jgi:hypothetical protein
LTLRAGQHDARDVNELIQKTWWNRRHDELPFVPKPQEGHSRASAVASSNDAGDRVADRPPEPLNLARNSGLDTRPSGEPARTVRTLAIAEKEQPCQISRNTRHDDCATDNSEDIPPRVERIKTGRHQGKPT